MREGLRSQKRLRAGPVVEPEPEPEREPADSFEETPQTASPETQTDFLPTQISPVAQEGSSVQIGLAARRHLLELVAFSPGPPKRCTLKNAVYRTIEDLPNELPNMIASMVLEQADGSRVIIEGKFRTCPLGYVPPLLHASPTIRRGWHDTYLKETIFSVTFDLVVTAKKPKPKLRAFFDQRSKKCGKLLWEHVDKSSIRGYVLCIESAERPRLYGIAQLSYTISQHVDHARFIQNTRDVSDDGTFVYLSAPHLLPALPTPSFIAQRPSAFQVRDGLHDLFTIAVRHKTSHSNVRTLAGKLFERLNVMNVKWQPSGGTTRLYPLYL